MVITIQWDTTLPVVYIRSGRQTSKMMINAPHQFGQSHYKFTELLGNIDCMHKK